MLFLYARLPRNLINKIHKLNGDDMQIVKLPETTINTIRN